MPTTLLLASSHTVTVPDPQPVSAFASALVTCVIALSFESPVQCFWLASNQMASPADSHPSSLTRSTGGEKHENRRKSDGQEKHGAGRRKDRMSLRQDCNRAGSPRLDRRRTNGAQQTQSEGYADLMRDIDDAGGCAGIGFRHARNPAEVIGASASPCPAPMRTIGNAIEVQKF